MKEKGLRLTRLFAATGALSLVALAVIAWGAFPVAAAEGIRTDYYKFYPSLKVSESFDTNIFQTAGDEVDDFITTIRPGAKLYFPYRNHFLQLEGEASFSLYAGNGDADNTTWKVGAALGGNYPGGLSFLLGDRYTRGWVQSQSDFTVAEYVDYNQFYGQVSYTLSEDFKAELQYFNYRFGYQKTDGLDRAENTASLTLYYKAFPKTSVLVELAASDIAYDEAPFGFKDNAVYQARAGVKWAATGRTTGEVRIGWQRKDYDEGSIDDVDTVVVTAPLSYAFSRSTLLEAELERGTFESDYTGNPYFRGTAFRADLSHKLTGKITATAGVSFRAEDYPKRTLQDGESGERSDDTMAGRLKLVFQMFRWLEVGAEGVIESRDSNFDRFDYDDTRVTLSATAAF